MIGVFDSGVGGLSVWREIVKRVPRVSTLYLADQAHVPYGQRTLEEARALTLHCVRWLIERGCHVVVIACNTASAAALEAARGAFPGVPIVGMEPAVKPAALNTKTGVVGVLATPATFKSQRYAYLIHKWASDVRVIEQGCKGWVEAVEGLEMRGWSSEAESDVADFRSLVSNCIAPLLDQNADTLVLGCTHFPFLIPQIEQVISDWRSRRPTAPSVTILDPAPAVAQQTWRVWNRQATLAHHDERSAHFIHEFWTTGDAESFSCIASSLLGRVVLAKSC
jgi:glutamate racemase